MLPRISFIRFFLCLSLIFPCTANNRQTAIFDELYDRVTLDTSIQAPVPLQAAGHYEKYIHVELFENHCINGYRYTLDGSSPVYLHKGVILHQNRFLEFPVYKTTYLNISCVDHSGNFSTPQLYEYHIDIKEPEQVVLKSPLLFSTEPVKLSPGIQTLNLNIDNHPGGDTGIYTFYEITSPISNVTSYGWTENETQLAIPYRVRTCDSPQVYQVQIKAAFGLRYRLDSFSNQIVNHKQHYTPYLIPILNCPAK